MSDDPRIRGPLPLPPISAPPALVARIERDGVRALAAARGGGRTARGLAVRDALVNLALAGFCCWHLFWCVRAVGLLR